MSERLGQIVAGIAVMAGLVMTPAVSSSQSRPKIAGAERVQITVGDLVFDAYAAGPENGELVILLHGFPETSWAYRHQIPALAEAGYRVVAPDQRGYSPGARPDEVAAYAWPHIVEDVIGIADALDRSKFHLVGHDWGGIAAWNTARFHSRRLLTLTVLSTPHPAALQRALSNQETDQSNRSSYIVRFQEEGSEEELLAAGAAPLREILQAAGTPAEIQPYLDALGSSQALRAALNWYRAIGVRVANAPQAPPAIEIPTLYVWSTEDGAFGRDAAEATREFVTAPYRFEVLEGVSHWMAEEAPDRITALLLEHIGSVREEDPRAIRAVERGIDAIGRTAFETFDALGLSIAGIQFARLQGAAPDAPADATEIVGRFVHKRNGPHWHASEWTARGGTRLSFVRVIDGDGGWRLWRGRREVVRFGANAVGFLRGAPPFYAPALLPYTRLEAARAAGDSLRWLGDGQLDGRPVVRVAWGSGANETRLAFDREAGFPISAERQVDDLALGRVTRTVRWTEWHEIEGLKIPGRVEVQIGSDPWIDWTIEDVEIDPPIDPTIFEPPKEIDVADSPPPFQPIAIGDKVWVIRLWTGPINTYNTMIVEFDDFVAVVEAPLADPFHQVVAGAVNQLTGGKPIRFVVLTHHHSDHVGGVRAYLRAGTTAVATQGTAAFLQGVAKRAQIDDASFLAFDGETVITDGRRKLRVIDVGPTSHVNEIALAYLEDEAIVFVSDLFAIPDSRVFPPPTEANFSFVEALHRLDIEPTTIVPGHGLVGTSVDLERAMTAGRVGVSTVELSAPLPSRGRLGGITQAADGSLVVSNFRASVWRISPNGDVAILSEAIRAPSGNAIDAQGDVLQSAFLDGTLHRIASDGTATTIADGLRGPVGIAIGPGGEIYVAECQGNAIAKIGADGTVERIAEGEPLNCPNGIAIGPDGALYVTSYSSAVIARITPDGETRAYVSVGESGGNAHLAWIGDRLFVTEIAANLVWEVGPDGSASVIAGTGEPRNADGPGDRAGLAHPNGIVADAGSGTLWVNTLVGRWKKDDPTRIEIQRIDVPTIR
jgi:pimeloyl-ACP methyl ester carboxylesterase/glyoxylase-like metal-dependent hydrolase (beta-lactamase superfamily II)/sugar lactone lactonase YvrE